MLNEIMYPICLQILSRWYLQQFWNIEIPQFGIDWTLFGFLNLYKTLENPLPYYKEEDSKTLGYELECSTDYNRTNKYICYIHIKRAFWRVQPRSLWADFLTELSVNHMPFQKYPNFTISLYKCVV